MKRLIWHARRSIWEYETPNMGILNTWYGKMKHFIWEKETLNMGIWNILYGKMKDLLWENETLIMGRLSYICQYTFVITSTCHKLHLPSLQLIIVIIDIHTFFYWTTTITTITITTTTFVPLIDKSRWGTVHEQ